MVMKGSNFMLKHETLFLWKEQILSLPTNKTLLITHHSTSHHLENQPTIRAISYFFHLFDFVPLPLISSLRRIPPETLPFVNRLDDYTTIPDTLTSPLQKLVYIPHRRVVLAT